MSAFAFFIGLTTVGVPALILLRLTGYLKDQRQEQRRSGKDGRVGGRRKHDEYPSPA